MTGTTQSIVDLYVALHQNLRSLAGHLSVIDRILEREQGRDVTREGEHARYAVQSEAAPVGKSLHYLVHSVIDGYGCENQTEQEKRVQMVAIAQLICPLGGNGLGDSVVWPALRRAGLHREAEEWTAATNETRRLCLAIRDGQRNADRAEPSAGFANPQIALSITPRATEDGQEAYDVSSELVRGRLATVLVEPDRGIGRSYSMLPAVNRHYWPKEISREMVIQAVRNRVEPDAAADALVTQLRDQGMAITGFLPRDLVETGRAADLREAGEVLAAARQGVEVNMTSAGWSAIDSVIAQRERSAVRDRS